MGSGPTVPQPGMESPLVPGPTPPAQHSEPGNERPPDGSLLLIGGYTAFPWTPATAGVLQIAGFPFPGFAEIPGGSGQGEPNYIQYNTEAPALDPQVDKSTSGTYIYNPITEK